MLERSSLLEISGNRTPKKGRVYSFTLLTHDHVPLEFKKYTPFVLALISQPNGHLITAQLTDLELVNPEENNGIPYKVEIDMEVEPVIRRIKEDDKEGFITYGYKFRPPISFSK